MLKDQILILLFALTHLVAYGQESSEWKLKYNKDGITAMTRKVIDSPYLEYKIQTDVDGSSVKEALNLITNVDQYKTIYPYLSEAALLNEDDDDSFDVLVVIKTPFPVKNRIGVYTNKIDLKQGEAIISISQNEKLIPESKHVKIEKCYGSWHFEESNENRLFITHTFFADPGGSIPAWIINSFALKQPVKTFRIIKKKLEN